MIKIQTSDYNTSNSNMSTIRNDPCGENHKIEENKMQRENSTENYVSSQEDADDDIRNNKMPVNEHSSASSKRKSSGLKRKKLPSSHLAQTLVQNSTSSITKSLTINDDHIEEKEIRQKKKTTKQLIQPKRDVLQQKYQELHQLLVLPLVQPVSKNVLKIGHLLHLQTFNEASENEVSPVCTHDMVSDINGNCHDTSLQHKKLKSLNRPLQEETRWRSQSSTDLGYSQWVRQNKNKQKNNTAEEKLIEKENQIKKQISHPSDTFLKNTNNPLIKQWLKKKEREIRKRKREERKKTKEERLKKQETEMLKQEKFKDSEVKVKEWMMLKRKEALTKSKESNQLEKDEIKNADCNTDRGLPLPESSEAISALSSGAVAQSITNLNISLKEQVMKPTPSSFVYARPVSGRVRLIKLQQLNKENVKKKELEKELFKRHLEKEKTKKMRVSYDHWLLKKREEDYAKRQEAARLRALSKSDSELHNIGIDIAQKRVKSSIRSKQVIDGNDSEIEKTADNENISNNGLQKIKVLGSKKNLNVRPSSARSSLSPRMSKTFHRPLSANPVVKYSGTAHDVEGKKNFRIPFPPETGAPKYVLDKQMKLFSPHLTLTTVCDIQKSDVGNHNEKDAINEQSNFDVNQTNEDGTSVIYLQMTKEVKETKQNLLHGTNVRPGKNEIKTKKEIVKVSELKDMNSIINKDMPIAKDLPGADEINNNSNKVMTKKDDKQNFNILEQILHSNTPQTFTDNGAVIANELEDRSAAVLPGVASNSSVLKVNENEDYSSDTDSGSEAVQEISDVSEPDFPRQQEEISVSESDFPRQQEEISVIEPDSTRQQEEISVSDPDIPRQQEEISVSHPDIPSQQEEISDLSVTRNSVKHVSFQESPVVFESSDSDIQSDSSQTNEIEEDLPEEDDEF